MYDILAVPHVFTRARVNATSTLVVGDGGGFVVFAWPHALSPRFPLTRTYAHAYVYMYMYVYITYTHDI